MCEISEAMAVTWVSLAGMGPFTVTVSGGTAVETYTLPIETAAVRVSVWAGGGGGPDDTKPPLPRTVTRAQAQPIGLRVGR